MAAKTPGVKAIADAISAAQSEKPDTAQKPYRKILEQEINEGLRELQRPTVGLLISGLSAGLDVSFSALVIAVMLTWAHGISVPERELLIASGYTVGYIFVIMGRSELFTEHTTRSVYPILHGDAPFRSLVRLWFLIWISNLAGCVIFAKLIASIGSPLGIIAPSSLGYMANGLVSHPGWVILVSGLLAGWLMGLLSWLVTAGRDSIAQIALVAIITGVIGICHLPHCIVGSTEVLAGVFAGQGATFAQFGRFLFWASLGNAIGGFVFVALIKYGHVMAVGQITEPEPDPVKLDESH